MAGGDDGLLRRGRRGALLSGERDYSHRSRIDKLGVRPGHAVHLVGPGDAVFESELAARGASTDAGPPYDLIFLWTERVADLVRLDEFRKLLDPGGAIWVLRARGNSRTVGETDIIDAAKRYGLVDNKIASFSDTLSAMRLVIPLARRRPSGGE